MPASGGVKRLRALAAALAIVLGAHLMAQHRMTRHWLAVARQAPRTVSYTGAEELTVFVDGRAVQSTVRVRHVAPDRTRLDYQDGELAGMIVVTRGDRSWSYDPRTGRTDCSTAPAMPTELRGAVARALPGPRVAGRPTMIVHLRAGDTVQDMCIDRATGVILVHRTRRAGHDISRSRFLEFDETPAPSLAGFDAPGGEATAGAEPMSLADLSARLHLQVRAPKWLPAGLKPLGTYLYRCPCCGMESAQLVYGDGVRFLSVFEQSKAQTSCLADQGCCALARQAGGCVGGACVAGSVVANLDHDPLLIALGDAGEAELRRVVESVP